VNTWQHLVIRERKNLQETVENIHSILNNDSPDEDSCGCLNDVKLMLHTIDSALESLIKSWN
jgi:hypothetical protein